MNHVVFLHGLGQTPQSWQEQVVALPQGWTASAPWVHGLDLAGSHDFDVDAAVAAVVTGLDAGGVRRAHVVAVGLGAVVATRLAARFAARVDRMVLSGGQVRQSGLAGWLQPRLLGRVSDQRMQSQGINRARVMAVVRALRDLDLREDLPQVVAPTLVVHGSTDRAGRPGDRALAAGIAGARYEQVDGGQRLNTDNPRAFNAAAFAFLAERGLSAVPDA
ncbi:alpha/beta fold hydrolase [Nocardioides sp. LHG3406-4]|uniref:alpha/beta fold hydrolase n=1 Tax=Nocardioides sp. LHG3406-4 TaxID=2804575 RepID=UPI003CEC99F9